MPDDLIPIPPDRGQPCWLPVLGQEADVERINPYIFYDLGADLRALKTEYSVSVPAHEVSLALLVARWRLDGLLHGLPIEVTLSQQLVENLRNKVDNIVTKILPTQAPDGTTKPPEWSAIPPWEWSGMRSELIKFENVFSAEMEKAAVYSVPHRGLYSVSALVDEADSTFPIELKRIIPDKALDDFQQAGRCLAFALPTASGFHGCRAIEGMLELYYQTFTKKTGTLKGWQDYIDALNAVIAAGVSPVPDAKTVHNLEAIKNFDRNPLMHPRAKLSEIDARILFSMAEIAILGMAQEVCQVKPSAGIAALKTVLGSASGGGTNP